MFRQQNPHKSKRSKKKCSVILRSYWQKHLHVPSTQNEQCDLFHWFLEKQTVITWAWTELQQHNRNKKLLHHLQQIFSIYSGDAVKLFLNVWWGRGWKCVFENSSKCNLFPSKLFGIWMWTVFFFYFNLWCTCNFKAFLSTFWESEGKNKPSASPSNAETKRPGNLSAKRNQKPGGTKPPRVRTATRKKHQIVEFRWVWW